MLSPIAARRVRVASRVGYVCVILLATLTHFHADPDPARIAWRLHRALHWATHSMDVVDAARNVALFAGFGAVWLATSRAEHPWRNVARITLLGFALSMSVETAQLWSSTRTSSINDVTTNTIGAFVGSFAIVMMTVLLRRARSLRTFIGVPMFAIAAAYVGAVGAEMFSPLQRHELNPWAGGSIINRLMNALHYVRPLTLHSVSRADMALFCPAGLLAVAALVELGASYGAACWLAILGGFVMSISIEIAHGIAGQPIELGAIASHTLGIAIGAIIGWRWIPAAAARVRGRNRAALLLAAYAILLALWAWRPFELRLHSAEIFDQLTVRHLTPLGVLGMTSDLFGVMDLAEQFFLYLPLGCVLAVWPLRTRGRFAYVLPALYFAVALEAGQILVRTRLFDVTDLLTQCAAVAIGYVVTRHAGYGVCGELVPSRRTFPSGAGRV